MKVKIRKTHPEAVIPRYAKAGDAGMDLVAVTKESDDKNHVTVYGTGLEVEIPEGHVGLIFPRSSVYKTINRQSNCVGVIDSGYRGELKVTHELSTQAVQALQSLKLASAIDDVIAQLELADIVEDMNTYKVGDRVAQLVIIPYPQIEFEEVEELSSTSRGDNGFGSTGA